MFGTPGSGPDLGPVRRTHEHTPTNDESDRRGKKSAAHAPALQRKTWIQYFWIVFDFVFKIMLMGMAVAIIVAVYVIVSKMNDIQKSIDNVNILSAEAVRILPQAMSDGAKTAMLASETITNATQHTGAWFQSIDSVFKSTDQITPDIVDAMIGNVLTLVIKAAQINTTELADHVETILEVTTQLAQGLQRRKKLTFEIPLP